MRALAIETKGFNPADAWARSLHGKELMFTAEALPFRTVVRAGFPVLTCAGDRVVLLSLCGLLS